MSLINEALKKAQRMRHQDGPGAPASSPETAAVGETAVNVPLRRGKAPRSQTMVFIVAIPLAILLSAGLTWWLLRSADAPAVAQVTTPSAAAPKEKDTAPGPNALASVPAPIAVPEPAPIATPPPAVNPAGTESATVPVAVAPPPETSTVGPATAPAPAPEVPAGPRANPRVNAFLDTLRVTGIRASATDPRVSMNERVFRLNDIVDRTLELRIIGIAPEGLTFIDPAGMVYKVQF